MQKKVMTVTTVMSAVVQSAIVVATDPMIDSIGWM